MMNNELVYEKLSLDDKKVIQMYLEARSFKNAIFDDEVIIIPGDSKKINIPQIGVFKPKVCGNSFVNRIIPYIVNKSFAIELYLKLILKLKGIDLKKLKPNQRHNLFMLYELIPQDVKEELKRLYIKAIENASDKKTLEEEIQNISCSFTKWRYIHENIESENIISSGFLSWYCSVLDILSKLYIYEKYGYDVDKDAR